MEFWDAYNEFYQPVPGKTLIRGEPIPEGCCHLVCDVLIRHRDGTYLLMQRDPAKHLGGLWEASAGGSVLKGETAAQGAMREAREETGITGKFAELGTVVDMPRRTIYVQFLCETNLPKTAVTLQAGETVDYRWVTKEELLALPEDSVVIWSLNRVRDVYPELWEGE